MTSQVLQRADEARRGALHRLVGVVQKVLRGLDDDRGAADVRATFRWREEARHRGFTCGDGVRASLATGRCAGFGIWLHAGRREGVVFSSGHVRVRHLRIGLHGRVARLNIEIAGAAPRAGSRFIRCGVLRRPAPPPLTT